MNLPTQKYTRDLRKYYQLPSVQVSLTIVLSLFVISIFVTFALRPTIVSIVTLQKTIEVEKKTLQQLDAKVTSLQRVSTQLESIKPFLPTLNTNIPNKGAMYSPLTAAVEVLASQTETELESETLGSTLLFSRILTPFNPSKKQSVVALPFSVRVIGSYPGSISFLTKLLSMERIVKIDSVTITKEVGAKNSSTTVALNISGDAYYLADEAQLEQALLEPKGNK